MKLPKSAEAYGRDDFEDVLEGELDQQECELPLEDYCIGGGFPRLDEVSVESVEATDDEIRVRVTLGFVELIASGCPDNLHEDELTATLLLVIDRDSGDTEIEDPNADAPK